MISSRFRAAIIECPKCPWREGGPSQGNHQQQAGDCPLEGGIGRADEPAMTTWLYVCTALCAILAVGLLVLMLLDPDAIPGRRSRSRQPRH
jgi:hypothetical protein